MVRLALVGCGGYARIHAGNLKTLKDEAQVAALCDPMAERTARFKQEYFPEAAVYDSYERMLDDASLKLDGVVLVTPHTLHYPQCKAALERGLHVLVEKPMVTSVEHAYDLWRLTKKSGKLLGIAFQAPHTAEYGYLASLRDSGEWGKVQVVSGWVSQAWYSGTTGRWRQDPSLAGGGFMYDTGAHLLNAIMWLMNDPVVEVSCMIDTVGCPVDINGVATLRFQNGALGSVSLGGNVPQFATSIQIMTDRLLIQTDQYGHKLQVSRWEKTVYPHVRQELDTPGAGTPQLNFIRAIQGKEPLRSPVRYGVLLSALMDAMYESAEKRKPVEVKPVPQDID